MDSPRIGSSRAVSPPAVSNSPVNRSTSPSQASADALSPGDPRAGGAAANPHAPLHQALSAPTSSLSSLLAVPTHHMPLRLQDKGLEKGETYLFGANNRPLLCRGVLGEGTMGVVYEVLDTRTKTAHALKTVLFNEANTRVMLEREVALQQKCQGPHVVHVDAVDYTDTHGYILMELGDGHTLLEKVEKHIDEHSALLPPREALKAVQQAIRAVVAVHAAGVIHQDIQAQNFVLCAGDVKLADFGYARRVEDTDTHCGGTPGYTAQEVIVAGHARIDAKKENRPMPVHVLTQGVDVFSLGALCQYMLTRCEPFYCHDIELIAQATVAGDRINGADEVIEALHEDDTIPEEHVQAVSALIDAMIAHNPSDRPSAAAVLARLDTILSAI